MYGYLVDLSDEAIAQSIENAKLLEVTQHLRIVKSDLFEAIEPIQVDMIISNPPYIEHEVIESLEDEVKRGEPMMALDGGVDGLDFYKRIIESAMDHLNPGGFLMFEIGYNQLNAILDLMVLAGYKQVRGYQDLSGLDRMVIGQKQVNNGGDTIE